MSTCNMRHMVSESGIIARKDGGASSSEASREGLGEADERLVRTDRHHHSESGTPRCRFLRSRFLPLEHLPADGPLRALRDHVSLCVCPAAHGI